MGSNCFWCASGINGSVPSPVGAQQDALGCCVQCQVFSCGHHAIRDVAMQEYKCYRCLVISLIGISVSSGSLTDLEKERLTKFDKELDVIKRKELGTKKLSDFSFTILEIPQIEINWQEWPPEIAVILQKLKNEEKKFLIAAGWILNQVEGIENISEIENPFRYSLVKSINVNAFA